MCLFSPCVSVCVCVCDVWSPFLREMPVLLSCKTESVRTNLSFLFVFPWYNMSCHIWSIKQEMRSRTNIILCPLIAVQIDAWFSSDSDAWADDAFSALTSQRMSTLSKVIAAASSCSVWRRGFWKVYIYCSCFDDWWLSQRTVWHFYCSNCLWNVISFL